MAEEGFLQGLVGQQLSPQGLVGGELSDIEQRRKNRLALALESQKIELMMKQKEREQQMELAGNASKLAQAERQKLIPQQEFDAAFGPTLKKASIGSTFSTSEGQQSALGLVKGLPVAEFKGNFKREGGETIGIGWAHQLAKQKPGGLSDQEITEIANSPKTLAYTYLKMHIKDDKVQKEMADRISGMEALPNLFQHLDEMTVNPTFGSKVRLFVSQYGATSKNLVPQLAAELASPGINQAFQAATTLMRFGEGGKNLTANEEAAVNGLLTSAAYGPESVQKAKRQFVSILKERIRGILKSGELSDWRDTLRRTNNALIDSGMEPITLDDMSITEKPKPSSKFKVGKYDVEVHQ